MNVKASVLWRREEKIRVRVERRSEVQFGNAVQLGSMTDRQARSGSVARSPQTKGVNNIFTIFAVSVCLAKQ